MRRVFWVFVGISLLVHGFGERGIERDKALQGSVASTLPVVGTPHYFENQRPLNASSNVANEVVHFSLFVVEEVVWSLSEILLDENVNPLNALLAEPSFETVSFDLDERKWHGEAGSCSTDKGVRDGVETVRGYLEGCYSGQRRVMPNLKGWVEAELEIDSHGRVHFPRISESTLDNPVVETCILNGLAHVKFKLNQSTSGCSVVWPFVFRFEDEQDGI